MSRVLADLLNSHNLSFRLGIAELERMTGMPNIDIRLGSDLSIMTRRQVKLLGLDANDTTGPELFAALNQRLLDDEKAIRQALEIEDGSSRTEMLQKVHKFLETAAANQKVLVLKQTVMRSLLKKLKPKATMKALGYRSMDSMLKHESVLQLLVATDAVESEEWRTLRRNAYAKMQTRDFEFRKIQFVLPTGKKWPEISRKFVEKNRHNMIINAELGGVVILPIEAELPGQVLLSTVLGLQAVQLIQSRSSLLKLHQVQPNFNEIFLDIVDHEPMTDMEIAGKRLPWGHIHWFYGSKHAPYHPDFFEPHLQPDDFAAVDLYASLEGLHKGLGFWRDGEMLALVDESGKPVSFNLLDVALGVCNGIEYGARFVHNMQATLWRELVGRYLGQESLHAILEKTLGEQFTPELSFEEATTS